MGHNPPMDVRTALKGQYKAGLAMLRDCIVKCPDDVWAAGMPPLTPTLTLPQGGGNASARAAQERESRTFWRIAYHALFYTHLYAMPRLEEFKPWPRHIEHAKEIWIGPDEEVPPIETTYTQAEVLEYLEWIETQVDGWVDALDLDSQESGFYWYKDFPKLDHQVLNVRHLGTHVGQLSERLFLAGIDTVWVGKGSKPRSG
jgi:hypothetical protein